MLIVTCGCQKPVETIWRETQYTGKTLFCRKVIGHPKGIKLYMISQLLQIKTLLTVQTKEHCA